ncbi:hypothetical protein [Lentilactobacillus hilgardii]|uniref:Uncharacterized protein n=1 Tax=Lentilactobacillus hilgardii TaxID=1588 RepID=A0A6P1E6F8_LENHI|nr:hypothetical protein [Lentilactobacillus hilgardii]EEI71873.1 hypothetical protein HMPREF0496_0936 [Lentilactobacillus hilgardii ATCC 27305]MCT3392362.1 hypothetical protein [Lentilactobacillus hilgardii]QHB51332.1 hypothetical protein GQR93_03400 [Lentilactobacillus hilgardii]RRG07359.1 MAG: hypothetical protein DUD35_13895 [Lactobacillus sp.]
MSKQWKVQLCYWATFIIGGMLAFHINTREWLRLFPNVTDQEPKPRSLLELMMVSDFIELIIISALLAWLATRFLTKGQFHRDQLIWINLVMIGLMTVTIICLIVYPASSPLLLTITWSLSLLGSPFVILKNDSKIVITKDRQYYFWGVLIGIFYIVMLVLVFYGSTM